MSWFDRLVIGLVDIIETFIHSGTVIFITVLVITYLEKKER